MGVCVWGGGGGAKHFKFQGGQVPPLPCTPAPQCSIQPRAIRASLIIPCDSLFSKLAMNPTPQAPLSENISSKFATCWAWKLDHIDRTTWSSLFYKNNKLISYVASSTLVDHKFVRIIRQDISKAVQKHDLNWRFRNLLLKKKNSNKSENNTIWTNTIHLHFSFKKQKRYLDILTKSVK